MKVLFVLIFTFSSLMISALYLAFCSDVLCRVGSIVGKVRGKEN